MIIEDGHGSGIKAKVGKEGCLCTKAVAIPFAYHINQEHQEAYSIVIEKTPTAAGDCFFYIKNNSESSMIGINVSLAVDTTKEVVRMMGGVVGTPAGTTDNIPVNLNGASGKSADVDSYDGVDITGLSGGANMFEFVVAPDESSKTFKTDTYVILPKNGTMALYAVTGGINIHCMLSLVFHDSE